MDPWNNPFASDNAELGSAYNSLLEIDRIGENEPFIAVQRLEEKESAGANSWDPVTTGWTPVDTRLARPFSGSVEEVTGDPIVAAFAQPLVWTASHGVEPAKRALGANGCSDCHSEDSNFFFGPVMTDPFTDSGAPETKPMFAALGYNPTALRVSAWRENVLKVLAPWVVLAVLVIMLIHYVLIGSKGSGENGEVKVLRFRFYERTAHMVSMVTVVGLCITGFCFLLGKADPLGPWARWIHTWFGYLATGGVAVMFLFWFGFMFPAKGDLAWLLKAGGYLGFVKGHLPSGKFNAGQKALFWIAMAACAVLAATGILMGLNRGAHFANQELLYTIHDVAALAMILLLMAHIYLAAIVVPHSLRAIFGGKVGAKWAKEHHSLWKI